MERTVLMSNKFMQGKEKLLPVSDIFVHPREIHSRKKSYIPNSYPFGFAFIKKSPNV